jgi:hypothetical protein
MQLGFDAQNVVALCGSQQAALARKPKRAAWSLKK